MFIIISGKRNLKVDEINFKLRQLFVEQCTIYLLWILLHVSTIIMNHVHLSSLCWSAALRTLRILKSISFFKGLQVLVTALIQTFRTSILYLMILLLVLMFLFATMGFNFFGSDPGSDKKHWGSFGSAMLSLFTLVTVSG